MDDPRRPRLKIWTMLGWVLSLAALAFVIKWVSGVKGEVWGTLFHLKIGWVAASLVLFQVWFWLRFMAWEKISASQGYGGERHENLRMWTISELIRYVPGNVWSFAARYRGVRTGGTERGASANALVAEAGSLVAGAAIVTTLFAPLGAVTTAAAIVAVGAVVALIFLPKIIVRLPKHQVVQPLPHLGRIIWWYVLVWLVYGVATACLWYAFPDSRGMSFTVAIGVNVGSWLIGYLSIITPMGLGVREVAFVKLLPLTVGQALGTMVAIVTRLWFVICELVFLGLVLTWSTIKRS